MILKPKNHNGIVVYYDRPNRYDITNGYLMAGPPGDFLRETIRDCGIDPAECLYTTDLQLNPAIHGYKVLYELYLGQTAHACRAVNRFHSLNDVRGEVYLTNGVQSVSSYEPIDCTDIVDHESRMFDDEEDDDADSGSNNKDSSPTARRNYRFWLRSDIRKLLLKERRRSYHYNVQTPSSNSLIPWLNSLNDTVIFFDIETHPPTDTVQCFAIGEYVGPVYSVPCYDYNGLARHHLPRLFAALAKAFTRNIVVGHNISFDLAFLFHFHGVPFGHRLYDTMLAHHRCFPEAEKSLGHAVSYWINSTNHKGDAGTFTPHNSSQFNTLLEYNARDVLVLREIYIAQHQHFAKDKGLEKSVTQANAVQYDYLVAGLRGIVVDNNTRRDKVKALTAELTQLTRVFRILVGDDTINPSSGQQLGRWLYEGLGYPVLDKTDTGAGKTDIKTLYKLLQKFPQNVALKVLLIYKAQDKVLSMLGFEDYYVNESRV